MRQSRPSNWPGPSSDRSAWGWHQGPTARSAVETANACHWADSRAGQQTQASVIARFGQGIEEPLQQQGSFTVEHIALGHQAGGESADPKGAAQVFGLLMTTHQHAEICGGESIASPAASAPNNQAGKGESSWPLALAQIRTNWDWARVTAT